ncbi:hypothetical protein KAR29_02755 [Aminithiophilus ramosus]|uniref:Uncharacterized protein n=1 Tax=Aminithiophilus ramosus TaxID=3029084 RepID=A0A9Q7EWJ2_9BACT|nr:hypothetical protein [Aminithiophilus ramosus]QTX32859.1 hypothetical protein KAR29_02755 [Aminithiophilus ramosus]
MNVIQKRYADVRRHGCDYFDCEKLLGEAEMQRVVHGERDLTMSEHAQLLKIAEEKPREPFNTALRASTS